MGGQWRGAEILNIKQNRFLPRYYSMLQLIYAHIQGQIKTKQVEGANGHRDSYFGMVSITSPFVIFMYNIHCILYIVYIV